MRYVFIIGAVITGVILAVVMVLMSISEVGSALFETAVWIGA